ncbi:MAG TPA: PRC-barrel domain-containing protein [Candidatus Acidoferrales bacterium]|nr:PRC-barrel domain-containing protein [Candidatus Acidoferrales bacterium]
MENDKPLTRDALVSMQVIDAKGRLVGKVKDVAFAIGKNGISITVESDEGDIKNVAWEEVQAASDFIILKPVAAQPVYQQQTYQQPAVVQAAPVQQQQAAQSQPLCSTCGKPLTWIPQYQRWYCYNDKKYA